MAAPSSSSSRRCSDRLLQYWFHRAFTTVVPEGSMRSTIRPNRWIGWPTRGCISSRSSCCAASLITAPNLLFLPSVMRPMCPLYIYWAFRQSAGDFSRWACHGDAAFPPLASRHRPKRSASIRDPLRGQIVQDIPAPRVAGRRAIASRKDTTVSPAQHRSSAARSVDAANAE